MASTSLAVDELRFVGIDRKHELLAGVEAAEIEHDLRAAVDDGHAVDREAIGADDREAAVVERAEAAGGRVEEHVAFGEAVLLLVAVDREAVERRAGRAADERNFDDVRLAVVARGLFEIHRAEQHLRRERRRPSGGAIRAASIWQRRRRFRIADCGLRIATRAIPIPPTACTCRNTGREAC